MTVSVGICRDACRLRCERVQARVAANWKSFAVLNYKRRRGGAQGKKRRAVEKEKMDWQMGELSNASNVVKRYCNLVYYILKTLLAGNKQQEFDQSASSTPSLRRANLSFRFES